MARRMVLELTPSSEQSFPGRATCFASARRAASPAGRRDLRGDIGKPGEAHGGEWFFAREYPLEVFLDGQPAEQGHEQTQSPAGVWFVFRHLTVIAFPNELVV